MARKGTVALLLVVFLMALVIAGCSKPGVSEGNYEKIKIDMTLAEVEKILGSDKKGSSITGQLGELAGKGAAYVWEDGDKKITVFFKDDKVVNKAQVGL